MRRGVGHQRALGHHGRSGPQGCRRAWVAVDDAIRSYMLSPAGSRSLGVAEVVDAGQRDRDIVRRSEPEEAVSRARIRNREASMHRKTVGVMLTMGVVVAALADIASAQSSLGSAALDASLRVAIERKDVPGVVALITDRERVLYQSAFGVADVATGRPLTADALFRIASMTKPITSLALMQLVEQGRLGLDDPAENYLPELAGLKVFESFDAATGAYQ